MHVAIVGSRIITDYSSLLAAIEASRFTITGVVSGGALGVDLMAQMYAKENNLPITIHYPDWEKYGKSAGIIRNGLIEEDADACIALWNGKSNGTRNTIERFKKSGKPLFIFRV